MITSKNEVYASSQLNKVENLNNKKKIKIMKFKSLKTTKNHSTNQIIFKKSIVVVNNIYGICK